QVMSSEEWHIQFPMNYRIKNPRLKRRGFLDSSLYQFDVAYQSYSLVLSLPKGDHEFISLRLINPHA
ncbi:MAG: hypothetical protein ACXACY_31390, partial [Candidatus Hodarchaeales archaeon]